MFFIVLIFDNLELIKASLSFSGYKTNVFAVEFNNRSHIPLLIEITLLIDSKIFLQTLQ